MKKKRKAGRPKIVTKEVLAAAEREGKTIQELAKYLDVTPGAIYRSQAEFGVSLPSGGTMPNKSRTVAITAQMCKILADGKHLCQYAISRQYRVSRAYIGQIAQAMRDGGWKF